MRLFRALAMNFVILSEQLPADLDVDLDRFEQFLLGELLKGRVGNVDGARAKQQRLAPVGQLRECRS